MADYLLDTNTIVIYARGSEIARRLEGDLQLMTGQHNLVISAVSIGEVKSMARRNNWGEKKIARLEQLLKRFIVADINADDVFEQYAIIENFSLGNLDSPKLGRSAYKMGKNDLWIAATGSVLQLVLITADKDFDHLDGHFLEVKRVDLSKYQG